MPARAERIYIYPYEKGQPGQVMRFPVWWDRSGFFDKFSSRKIALHDPNYVDYAWLLTFSEALVWDEQCRGQFSHDPRSMRSDVGPEMVELETALKKARWVIVESYEWESGLA